jgi:hypothetical protein
VYEGIGQCFFISEWLSPRLIQTHALADDDRPTMAMSVVNPTRAIAISHSGAVVKNDTQASLELIGQEP